MKKRSIRLTIVESVREIVFGAEDSFVSTLGAVTGIAAGVQNASIVILSGLVLIAVEATSMAAGSYLSSKTAADAEQAFNHQKKGKRIHTHPIRGGVIMWFSYALAGFFPLFPYFILPVHQAVLPSIVVTAIMLFLLGALVSRLTKRSAWKSGFEMATVSLVAAVIGYVIGRVASMWLGLA